ncbi:hypothetical protein ALQ53_04640 [Pseudomonas cannabina]|uniref:Uncharacterized protein n=2 Tax=Pseudomonas cannabina TaxID=86840 RepID=A0AB37Q1U8_PSECA|nr:hypothetical protein ALQ53_04640 [Pseudomonas cannabina]RMN86534.1 hypothetical protein ALQ52_04435 [Pseudomonas cannabina pv. alisalensis]
MRGQRTIGCSKKRTVVQGCVVFGSVSVPEGTAALSIIRQRERLHCRRRRLGSALADKRGRHQPLHSAKDRNARAAARMNQTRDELRHTLRLFHHRAQHILVRGKGRCNRVGFSQFASQHIRTNQRQRSADPAQRRNTPGRIAQQHHRPVRPAIDLHLSQVIEPEVLRSLHPGQQTRHLPARAVERRPKKRLLLGNTVADRKVAATVHIKERPRRTAIVRTNPSTATAHRVIPTRGLTIGRRTRHGKECACHVHPARLILAGEHQLPRTRPDTLRNDQQIKTLLVTALERDRHTRLIMLDRDDTITKAIEGVGRRSLIQQAGEITTQHLKLGRRTIAVQPGQINLRRRAIVLIDPRQPRLAGIKLLHRLLKPHQTQHLPSRAAHIHILPAIAKGRRLLDNRDIAIALRQPPCSSAACDAGPGDENAARAALDALELVDKMASVRTNWLGVLGASCTTWWLCRKRWPVPLWASVDVG